MCTHSMLSSFECARLTSSHVGICSINKQQQSDVFITEVCALAENVREAVEYEEERI